MTEERQRSTAARIGITLLNLLAPGLGLLRVAGLRTALKLLAGPWIVVLAPLAIAAIAPRPTFPIFVIVFGTMAAITLALFIVSIVWTWRASRYVAPVAGWSRWYAMLAVFVLVTIASNLIVEGWHRLYKPFYIPSEAMLPTLAMNDHILADMRGGRHPERGDIVLFAMPELHTTYIKRVVGLPGDRIAMVHGVPVINGHPARRTAAGTVPYEDRTARKIREVLPGEHGSHEVLDLEDGPLDDVPEQVVPGNALFVLGDNRDRSADSRVSRSEYGVGWLPVTDLIGAPLFVYWSPDAKRVGADLTHSPR